MKIRSKYDFKLAHRTNGSDNIMATSAQFSVTTSAPAQTQDSIPKHRCFRLAIIAVPTLGVIFVIAGSVLVCRFRKPRGQFRAQFRWPPPKPKRRSSVGLNPRNQLSGRSLYEAKPNIEERSAEKGFKQHASRHEFIQVLQKLTLPLPLPLPLATIVKEIAELGHLGTALTL